MSILQGSVIAVASAAVTLVVVGLAGLALVALQIQEERRGSGCRAAGCRRSRPGQGRTTPRGAETARGIFTERD